ncbi:MAG: septal ring lytic transglycosylase RlpA family protein [Treponema sp.]|nr:septal ring lytic transglycosylase RlpA family protein [Treponema sp.]
MRKLKSLFSVLLLTMFTSAFADTLYKSSVVASYYADKYNGRKTSSGEIFNMNAYTAAHKTLPFNTVVRVTNLENGKSVQVRINDRGPFVAGREIDLSKAAAAKIDMVKTGTAKVRLDIVSSSKEIPVYETTTEKWDIQLGAFSQRANAQTFAKRLMSAGFENVVYQKTENLTKVVIKDVATDDVQAILDKLEAKGFTDYFVRERAKIKK